MIKQITDDGKIDERELCKSEYGCKILSYYYAYGIKYDFCRFYEIINENAKCGFIFMMNSTMVIHASEDADKSEIYSFIEMNMPFRIELSQLLMPDENKLVHYQKLRRTRYEFANNWEVSQSDELINENPKLDDVYKILSEGFPNLLDYGLWITDTSHRIRKGISRVYTYKNCTTASVLYDINDTVLVGQVATGIASRGSGYARELLYWLGRKICGEGKRAQLYALDIRRSYYAHIGFKEADTDYVLERCDVKKESQQKGALK